MGRKHICIKHFVVTLCSLKINARNKHSLETDFELENRIRRKKWYIYRETTYVVDVEEKNVLKTHKILISSAFQHSYLWISYKRFLVTNKNKTAQLGIYGMLITNYC